MRESVVTSKRIQRRMRRMATEGLPHGKIPYGYRRVYDPKTRRLLRQEPDTAPVVREIARRLLAGEALGAVALVDDSFRQAELMRRRWIEAESPTTVKTRTSCR